MKKYVVGIDIGGQSAKIGVVAADATIVAQGRMDTRSYGEGEHIRYMDDLIAAIHGVADPFWNDINGIGIGAPNANHFSGCIEYAANLPWAHDKVVPFCKYISEKTGLPVDITNDANAAAVGEMHYGAARGMKDFIEITLGTGVGSGIIVDGKLVYGHDGFAGELGHVTVKRGGRQCGCGKKGCLEAYASAIGVARTAQEWIAGTDGPSLLRGKKDITSKDVAEAAEKGDLLAKQVFDYTGDILGAACADFVAFSAPEAIIIFGGLAQAGDLLMKPAREAFEANLVHIWKGKVKFITSGLKESDAAILGASALAW